MEFLEGWLVERKTSADLSALVVSHDRRFLNAVADRIVEVANGRLEDYPGDYATYRKLKAERDRVRAKEAEKQRQMIERTEEFIRRNIAGQKTKQAQGRRKMLARIERIEAPQRGRERRLDPVRGGARLGRARPRGEEDRPRLPGDRPAHAARLVPPPPRRPHGALGAERLRQDDAPQEPRARPAADLGLGRRRASAS